jgi:hypothetical protein
MLTDNDVKKIRKAFSEEARFQIQELLGNDKLSHLPTKDEFFTRMDQISGEIKSLQSQVVISNDSLLP